MILVQRMVQRGTVQGRQIVILFGVGLIGRAISTALIRMGIEKLVEFPFSWTLEKRQTRELELIQQNIFASHSEAQAPPISRVDIVWAAGRSGFHSSDDQIMLEVRAFEKALSFSLQLLRRVPHAQHSFHLISSAGGLFEGQTRVDRTSLPRPLRPYSRAKLQQEQTLAGSSVQVRKMIYRLSTVYGFSGRGGRLGLVNTLIQNSILRRSSYIVGNALTIRDYVLVSDVGKFIANCIQDIDTRFECYDARQRQAHDHF